MYNLCVITFQVVVVSFHYMLSIAYLIIWNSICTIYLLEFNIFALFTQLTCWVADWQSHSFTGFISVKEIHFHMTFEVG